MLDDIGRPAGLGAEEVEDDDEAFAEKMQKLTETLGEQMAKGAELDAEIRRTLAGLASRKPKVQVPAISGVVFRHLYCKMRFLEEAGLGSRPTCTKSLRALSMALT